MLLAYENLKLARSGAIHNGSPQIVLKATFDALIFRPQVGTTVTGKVNKIGQGHIGMLVAGIFNASIPASEGISDHYTYNAMLEKWSSTTTGEVEGTGGEKSINREGSSGVSSTLSPLRSQGSFLPRQAASQRDQLPPHISLGTDIVFTVKRVSESIGLFAITGSLIDQKNAMSAMAAAGAIRLTEVQYKQRKHRGRSGRSGRNGRNGRNGDCNDDDKSQPRTEDDPDTITIAKPSKKRKRVSDSEISTIQPPPPSRKKSKKRKVSSLPFTGSSSRSFNQSSSSSSGYYNSARSSRSSTIDRSSSKSKTRKKKKNKKKKKKKKNKKNSHQRNEVMVPL